MIYLYTTFTRNSSDLFFNSYVIILLYFRLLRYEDSSFRCSWYSMLADLEKYMIDL